MLYQPGNSVAAENKNAKFPPFMREAQMVFSSTPKAEKLFVLENVMSAARGYTQCRVFDLKAKKELSKVVVADNQNKAAVGLGGGNAEAGLIYFTPNGDPRIIFSKSVLDGATGKELYKIDPGVGVYVTHDGKYLARVLATPNDAKKWVVESWSLENVK